MRIVVWIKPAVYAKALDVELAGLEGVELVKIRHESELATALEGAAAIISGGASQYTPEVAAIYRKHGKGLRWFQTISAGNDGFSELGLPHENIEVTGTGGHGAPVLAEHALALLLSVAHGMHRLALNMHGARAWGREMYSAHRSLAGDTAVVLGLGPTGAALARRLKANDMRVIGLNHSGRPHPDADETHDYGQLIPALMDATVLAVCAPFSSVTRGIVDSAALSALGPIGYLVNVSRGGLVDTVALEEALRTGAIKGAGLDVTDPEPLPSDHSLWSAPNLIISPHWGGGGNRHSPARLARTVRENVEAFRDGRPLAHPLAIYT